MWIIENSIPSAVKIDECVFIAYKTTYTQNV
jgi:hypothetical protein